MTTNRQFYNRLIIKALSRLVDEHPDIRFIQLLHGCKIITSSNGAIDDRFYESSGTTAEQMEIDLIDLEDAADKKLVQSHCHWEYSESEGSWDTACGNKFMLNDGTPSENRMRYCPYCGGALVEESLNNDRAWADSVDEVMRS